MREPRRRLVNVELRSRDGDSAVVAVPDGRGGEELLTLDPPYSSPQFLPDIGETVLLDMQGPVPQVLPRQIAVDAITAREARFDLVTTLLLYGAQIIAGDPDAGRIELDKDSLRLYRPDGVVTIRLDTLTGNALVTGEYRSAESGERFVINSGGTNPGEIRFYPATGDLYGSIKAETPYPPNGIVPNLVIKGPAWNVNGYAPNVELAPAQSVLSYQKGELTDPTHRRHRLVANETSIKMEADNNATVGGGVSNVEVDEANITIICTGPAVLDPDVFVYSPHFTIYTGSAFRFETNAVGVAVNGKTPAAPPALPPAATDQASALTLVNALRTLAIDTGWAVP